MVDNLQEELARLVAAYKAGENESCRKKVLYIAIAVVSVVLIAATALIVYKKLKYDKMDDFDEDFTDDDEDFWEEFEEENAETEEAEEEAAEEEAAPEAEDNEDLFEKED